MLHQWLVVICGALLFVSTTQASSADCNFNANFCQWRNVRGDQFDWTGRAKKTPSSGTGPQDPNYKGYFIFIEGSSPRRPGDKAILSSPSLSGVKCMRFKYHMYGSEIGSLAVFISHDRLSSMIWSAHGDQGREWKAANVTVYGNAYTVSLVGTVGGGYKSDLAVDDVSFVAGSCHGESDIGGVAGADVQNGSCSFDLGWCGWQGDQLGTTVDWSVAVNPSTKLPRRDHGGLPGGKYIYFDGSSQVQGTRAMLVSQPICGMRCLRLFHYMSGPSAGQLNIYQTMTDRTKASDRIVALSGDQGPTWRGRMIELSADDAEQCYRISIEGVSSGNRRQRRIAIDDVLVAEGSCCALSSITGEAQEKVKCDFDHDFCQWQNSPKADFTWSWGEGATSSPGTGPDADASGTGGYAYIEASEPRYRGQKAILTSGSLRGSWCMRFKYHMHGSDVGSVEVYRGNEVMWSRSGDHGNQWLQGHVDIDCSHVVYEMSIVAEVGAGWRGDIAVDEIEFTAGSCPVVNDTISTKPGQPLVPHRQGETCTFENSFCHWFNSADDDFDWERHSDRTPSIGTGPKYDYDGTGTYVYIEASGKRPTQIAKLSSKVLSGQTCLIFYYLMFGKFVAELKVEVWDLDTDSKQIVWSKVGEQDPDWLIGSVDLNGTNYKVSFVGVRGLSFQGDIALDVISTLPGLCSENANSLVLDAAYKEDVGDCDFDSKDVCNWVNEDSDDFDWKRNSGRTPSGGTGPQGDHGTGTGHYAFIETSSPRRTGDKARMSLSFPALHINTCLEFYYHMYGRDIGALRVYQSVEANGHVHDKILWERRVEKDRLWHKALVTISGLRRGFKVVIEGERGRDYKGDIAIDDLKLTRGPCPGTKKRH